MPQFYKRNGRFLTREQLLKYEAEKNGEKVEPNEEPQVEETTNESEVKVEPQTEEKVEAPNVETEPKEPTKEDLQKILDEKGVKYDKRWGLDRLQEMVNLNQ